MTKMEQSVGETALGSAWCNSDAPTTSVMEALSFATPAIERFLICTVVGNLPYPQDAALRTRCREFVRDESQHSQWHGRLNQSLLLCLGRQPPGLVRVERLLDGIAARLPLRWRMLLAAAMEHVTAVSSSRYLREARRWDFASDSARDIFARHAHEELAHSAVAYDLCMEHSAPGRLSRCIAMLAVLGGGMLYLAAAVPWILHRKTGSHLGATARRLAGFAGRVVFDLQNYAVLRQLFAFAGRNFHPDDVVADHAGL
jgi:predicted metal-dependent hydrolase